MDGQQSCFSNQDRIMGEFGVRTMHAKQVGYFIEKHVHNYGHLEIVACGAIELILGEDEPMILNVGEFVFVPAKIEHTARALKDNTIVHCIFHARDAEGVVDMANHPEFT